MTPAVTTVELFLIAMTVIFTVPFLIWRLGRTEYVAPLVVVQIITGVLLGPGLLGRWWPEGYQFVFTAPVIQSLNGLAWWAVSIFVFLAGLELDLRQAWTHRRSTSLTAGLALGVPLLAGCGAAWFAAGQEVPDDLEAAHGERFASRLLGEGGD